MLLENTDDELITELLTLTQETKLRLFVESETDVKFFQTHLWDKKIEFYDRNGWENVNNFLAKWNAEKKDSKRLDISVFGIIDRDYHDFKNSLLEKNILKTDYRDLEIIFFESDEVLRKIINQFFSNSKKPLDSEGNLDLNSIRNQIYNIVSIVGKLRLINALSSEKLSFSKVEESHYDFSKFVEKNLNYDLNKFFRHISASNHRAIEDIKSLFNSLELNDTHENKLICSGHDVIYLLGFSLKNKFGNVDAKSSDIKYLEPFLRNSYPTSNFLNTKLAKMILENLEAFENYEENLAVS